MAAKKIRKISDIYLLIDTFIILSAKYSFFLLLLCSLLPLIDLAKVCGYGR